MKRYLVIFIPLFFFSNYFCYAQSGNDNPNGGVRISFGNDNYVTPTTLSGDDPAIPPKPKRTFNTNSITLNLILQDADTFENVSKTLDALLENERITMGGGETCRTCFVIVYNLDTGDIPAVLDKGTGKRINLLTNQSEDLEAYPKETFGRIWFELED